MHPHMMQLRSCWGGCCGGGGLPGYAARRVALTLVVAGVGVKLYRCYQRRQRRQLWEQAGKDVVVLHQFERGTQVPNLSPFALKLETFLRMADITYVVDTQQPCGEQRGKCPWITFNGQEISDSELIIQFLGSFAKKPLAELSAHQHAVGRAVQVMLDEHAILFVAYKRYQLDNMKHMIRWMSKKYQCWIQLFRIFFSGKIRAFFWTTGVGRFSEEEAMSFLRREVVAVEDIMGGNMFLLGKEPSVYDAAVFAELTQIIYCCAPEFERFMKEKHAGLIKYHERMKTMYWPDWEQCRAQ